MNRITTSLCAALLVAACSEPKTAAPPAAAAPEPVVAPVDAKTVIEVPEFTVSTAPPDIAKGLELFATKGCVACHKVGGGKLVGPDLKGVTARRTEVWIKKMILKPEIMIKEDPDAKLLFTQILIPMPNQAVDPKTDLPFLMAYLKSVEK